MRKPSIHVVAEQGYIYGLLRIFGPMTDEQIWDRGARRRLGTTFYLTQKRRLELLKQGRIEYAGEKRYSRTGRLVKAWRAV